MRMPALVGTACIAAVQLPTTHRVAAHLPQLPLLQALTWCYGQGLPFVNARSGLEGSDGASKHSSSFVVGSGAPGSVQPSQRPGSR